MGDLHIGAQNRIKAVRLWSGATGRTNDSSCSSSSAPSSCRRTASSGARHAAADSSGTPAGRIRNHTSIYSSGGAARLCKQDVGIGNGQVIALHSDIEVVGHSNGNRIIHGKHQLAILDELLQPRAIGEGRRWDIPWDVSGKGVG